MGLPDYENCIDTSAARTYNIPQNGYLLMSWDDSTMSVDSVKINGRTLNFASKTTGWACYPVKKGDVITCTARNISDFAKFCPPVPTPPLNNTTLSAQFWRRTS